MDKTERGFLMFIGFVLIVITLGMCFDQVADKYENLKAMEKGYQQKVESGKIIWVHSEGANCEKL